MSGFANGVPKQITNWRAQALIADSILTKLFYNIQKLPSIIFCLQKIVGYLKTIFFTILYMRNRLHVRFIILPVICNL